MMSIYKDVCFELTLSFKFLQNDTAKELFVYGHSYLIIVDKWQPLVAEERSVVQAVSLSVQPPQHKISLQKTKRPQSLNIQYFTFLS